MKKNLRRLSKKERKQVLMLMKRILLNDVRGMNLKKLKGTDNAFRVRKGDFRVIFIKAERGQNRIIALERRSKSTYKKF